MLFRDSVSPWGNAKYFFFPFSFKVKKYVYDFICFYCRNVVLFSRDWQKVEQAADVFLRALKARVFRFPTRQNKQLQVIWEQDLLPEIALL